MKSVFIAGLLVLCAALPVRAGPGASMPATEGRPEAASRQILVMLRLPPQHYHPDAAYAGRYPDDGGRAARRRAAQEIAGAHGLTLVDDWPMPVIGIDCYVMQQEGGVPLDAVLQALARDPRVAWAQPMHMYHGLDGGDPLYPVQPAAQSPPAGALVAQLQPSANAAQLRRAILATHPPGPIRNTAAAAEPMAQAGNIDACASIARITGACPCSCPPTAAMKINSP